MCPENGIGLCKLTWATVCKMRSIRNDGINSVVTGSIIGFHLKGRASLGESAVNSTRGRKEAIANIFRSNTIGGGHLSS